MNSGSWWNQEHPALASYLWEFSAFVGSKRAGWFKVFAVIPPQGQLQREVNLRTQGKIYHLLP